MAPIKEQEVIAVIGASGQLGRTLCNLFDDLKLKYVGFSRPEIDISDKDSIKGRLNKPFSVFINCAAWTDVEKAESSVAEAFKVNQLGSRNIAKLAAISKVRLIHISTDYVFSGDSASPYTEIDPVAPLNQYGMSKVSGEQEVKEALDSTRDYLIVRTSWLYSQYGRNFAKTMVKKALLREPVRVVCDQVGQPTHAHDLASRIVEFVLKRELRGVFHMSSDGETTWYEFARLIYTFTGVSPSLVSPISSSEINLRAERPSYSTLDCSKAYSHDISRMPMWNDSLAKNIGQIIEMVRKESGIG